MHLSRVHITHRDRRTPRGRQGDANSAGNEPIAERLQNTVRSNAHRYIFWTFARNAQAFTQGYVAAHSSCFAMSVHISCTMCITTLSSEPAHHRYDNSCYPARYILQTRQFKTYRIWEIGWQTTFAGLKVTPTFLLSVC